MQRRRGLVSQPISTTAPHASSEAALKRVRSRSVSSDESSNDETTLQEDKSHRELHVSEGVTATVTESGDNKLVPHPDTGSIDANASKRKQKKGKRDTSDETRWQKMKVVGSEKEVMVDLTRVQKYVDYDSSTVQAFQTEVKSAKGNFRQQALADYSDL